MNSSRIFVLCLVLWIHRVHLGVHVHLVVHVSERVRVHVHVLVPHLLGSLAEHLLLSQRIVNLLIIRREGELVFLKVNQELLAFFVRFFKTNSRFDC